MRFKSNPFLKKSLLASSVAAATLTLNMTGYAAQLSDEISELEEVVIYGTRASLKKALDQKRDAIGVVDAIVAEDIGKFPDLNISESLQRITGVTINRGITGEGNTVSVRGLPPEYTRVTLNGMTATSGNEGREFDFDVFASELFSDIRISKTPSASLTEGGLAGTIDLTTPRPLNFEQDQRLLSISGQYAELGRDETTPRASGLFSWSNDDDSFGVLVSGSYSESTIRNDTTQGFRWETLNANSELDNRINDGDAFSPLTVDGVTYTDPDEILALGDEIAFPILPRVGLDILERERLGLTAAFQFRPTDKLELNADILYAEFEEARERHTIDGAPGFSADSAALELMTRTDGGVRYAYAGSFEDVSQRAESIDETFDSDLLHITIDGKYQLSDILAVTTAIGYSEASEDELRRSYLYNHVGDFSYDLSDPEWPIFQGADFDYLDPDDYSPDQLRFAPRHREDVAYKFRTDFDWQLDRGALSQVKAGIEYRDREKTSERSDLIPSFDVTFAEVATGLPIDDFLSGAPQGVVRDFLVTDLSLGRSLLLPDSYHDLAAADLRSNWAVNEKILSGYVESNWDLNLAGKDLMLNIGVRVANTDLTSDGYQRVTVGGENVFEPISTPNDYTDVLPSLNAKWLLSDDLILRFSANKAITRPTLSQLSAGTTINSTNTLTASSGNPMLDPFRAYQYDISLEWYFAPESLISVTPFYKDIDSFIISSTEQRVITGDNLINDASENVSGETFTVALPVNGTGGKLYGAEFTYQQPFTFLPVQGFGIQANLTVSESEGIIEQGGVESKEPLEGQSDLSYNLILYYENSSFSFRAAYSYRGEYVRDYRNGIWASGAPHTQYIDERKQLDLSARYHLNDNIEFYIDAININSEDYYFYDTRPGMSGDYFEQGAVYNFGVRAKL